MQWPASIAASSAGASGSSPAAAEVWGGAAEVWGGPHREDSCRAEGGGCGGRRGILTNACGGRACAGAA